MVTSMRPALEPKPIQLDAPDPALDSGRRLRGRGRGRIHDYLEAAGHGDDEQGPLFRPIRNNRTGRIDKALVAEGRHRGAVRHVEKTRGLPPPEPARPRTPGAGADRTHAVHARLARKPGICADAAMPGSTRASSVISSRRSSAPSNKAGLPTAVPRRSSFVPPPLDGIRRVLVVTQRRLRKQLPQCLLSAEATSYSPSH